MIKTISSKNAPKAIGPYSQGIQVGQFIFLSGQIPLNPSTNRVVEGDIKEQTEQVMQNIKGLLEDIGLSLQNVVKTTIFVRDIRTFDQVNTVYSRFLGEHRPARSTVEVSNLPKNVLVEIEAIVSIN
ncbi:RidA family protein [Neobacillus niacini]|uniref:RidA family protein n=1 Tax=Neobacillus niacini TaxID=86668 RepID=UPI0030014EEA